MNVKQIKEIIKDTGFHFRQEHMQGRVHDYHEENHDVIISQDHKYQISAAGGYNRNLWNVFEIRENRLFLMKEKITLADALSVAKE